MPDAPSLRQSSSGLLSWKFWSILSACVVVYTVVQLLKGLQTSASVSSPWGPEGQLPRSEVRIELDNEDGRLVRASQVQGDVEGARTAQACALCSSKSYNVSVVDTLLELRSGLAGFHQKRGVLNPKVWMQKYQQKRREMGMRWLTDSLPTFDESNRVNEAKMLPLHWPECEVNINHHYKFIFIKGKKVGGTTVRNNLGWICNDWWKVPPGTTMPYCSKQYHKEPNLDETQLEEWWKEYFVFGVVRNPFTRFTSGYVYLNTFMKSCPKPSFKQTCYDPFIQAKICGIASCCFHGSVGHHVHHMTDQSSCFFTEGGELAVDFVAETEELQEGLQIIVEEANKRRREGVPALSLDDEIDSANQHRGKSAGGGQEGSYFHKNPECLGSVARIYEQDFQRLKYDIEGFGESCSNSCVQSL